MSPPLLWTRDTILEAIHGWVLAHGGQWITQAAMHADPALPTKSTVATRIGTMQALKQAYEARYGSRAGVVTCPRCGERWWSPDCVEMQRHPYPRRKAGECQLPGTPRAPRRPRRRPPAVAPPTLPVDAAVMQDPYRAMVHSIAVEALVVLAHWIFPATGRRRSA